MPWPADALVEPLSRCEEIGLDQQPSVRRGASRAESASAAVRDLWEQIQLPDTAFALVFFSHRYARAEIEKALAETFGDVPVIGCTTAGEIGPDGYGTGSLSGVAFSSRYFAMGTVLIENLAGATLDESAERVRQVMKEMDRHAPGAVHDRALFGLFLVDGMTNQEERLVSSISAALGSVPLFGGSAADDLRFHETFVFADGRFRTDAAVLALIHTRCPFQVFRFDHFEPTGRKMVVTGADPDRRLVTEINAEPAASEYARLIGIDVDELSPEVFADHPVVVRVGGEYHVRAIQKVENGGALKFFCAVDEGLVLTLARPLDVAEHLDETLKRIETPGKEPLLVLGFDCILRRLEAQHKGLSDRVSRILARHRVVGFNTYGEQFMSIHANQTFTGVVIYPGGETAGERDDRSAA